LAELTAKNDIGLYLYNVGRLGEALEMFKEVYGSMCRVLGREHKDTLSIRGRIAFILNELCRYTEALEILKEVYESRCRVLGREHKDSLIAGVI